MSEDPTPADSSTDTGRLHLGVSTIIPYAVGVAILLLLIDLAEPVHLASRLRILDDLSDLAIVQVTDPGSGFIIVGVEMYEFARTPIRHNAAATAFVLVLGAMLVRGLRLRLIGNRLGITDAMTELGSSYFFGLGMNLFFPYGPGEYATVRTLTKNGADADAAVTTVYYGRLFEVIALCTGIFVGFLGLGWGGTVVPIIITLVVLVVLTAVVRPFGRGVDDEPTAERRRGVRGFLDWLNVTDVVRDLRRYFRNDTNHALGLYAISVLGIYLEVTGLWFLKEAFSTPVFDLLGGVTFVQFGLVVAAASLTRVVPITPAAIGIYEGLTVALFHFGFGQSYIHSVTLAFIDGVLLALVTAILFVYAFYRHETNVWETWRAFLGFSRDRATGSVPPDPDAVVGGGDD